MRPRHYRKRLLSGLGTIAVLGFLWFLLAPTALGGSTTYVVTHGTSMEPRFHSGDLVLVRSQSSYRVGEIVAYHSNVFHTLVLHRIIAREGDRYVFKGDNNNFVDFEHPAASQLIGALWLHIPGVGSDLDAIRSPLLVGVLIAAAALLFSGASFARRRRERRRNAPTRAAPATAAAPGATASRPVGLVVSCALVALSPFLLLALLAFTRPSTAVVPSTVAYRQSGALSYSARSAPGPIYPEDRAGTGEPLFTRVIDDVELAYHYRFHSGAPHALAGTASIDAVLSSTSGWQRTLPLAAPEHFHGNRADVHATMSLTSIEGLLREVEKQTDAGGAYTLVLQPSVTVAGRLGDGAMRTSFAPAFKFLFNEVEAQPVEGSGAPSSGAASASAFASSSSGNATVRSEQPLYLNLGPAQIAVATARAIAIVGMLLVAACALVALALVRPRRRDEAELILARYGRMIVPVDRVGRLPGVPVTDVADFDALVRIAEHYERSILHEGGGSGAFWVTDESGHFRYTPATAAPPTQESWIAPHSPLATSEPLAAELRLAAEAAPGTEPSTEVAEWDSEAAVPEYEPGPAPLAVEPIPAFVQEPADEESDVAPREGEPVYDVAVPMPEPQALAAAEEQPADQVRPAAEELPVAGGEPPIGVEQQPPAIEVPGETGEPVTAVHAVMPGVPAARTWAGQVAQAGEAQQPGEDWRAACEAAGIVLKAPTFP